MLRIISVILCLGAPALLAQEQINPLGSDPGAVAAGSKLYEQICQSCHGGGARGDRAPSLAAGVFPHGDEDSMIFTNIRRGIPGTQMPSFSGLTSDQIWQLVAYIRSLSGAVTRTKETVAGDPAAGEKIFFGKGGCNFCHEINGRGGIMGPDLSAAGKLRAQILREKILDPSTNARAGGRGGRGEPRAILIKTKDGREIRGVRRSEDTYSLVMIDTSGKLVMLDKRDIADEQLLQKSLMPADYGQRLSAEELQNLVAYLKANDHRDLNQTIHAEIPGGLTYERIANSNAEPQNWLTYWGDYQGRHFSSLKDINPANVGQLQSRWAVQMPGDSVLEATPLVVDGVMYTSGPPGQVFALDARTGLQIWKYQRQQKVVSPYQINPFNRGVAVLGNRVFLGTLDAALIALDARTGLPLWEVQVADTLQGYNLTSAPLAIKDKIIVGVACGEFGARGFVDAYDAATGKRLWRFYTIPGPGEFGHETWNGESWQQGGSPAWLTGSYDPDLDVLYWAVGNPGPDLDAEIRKGDNLFSCSVVALDPSTGRLKWHYQFTPGDSHDWDSTEDMVLVDRDLHGQRRKLLLHADRNGIFYVLDRTSGKFISGHPFVRQTWNKGFDDNGRPIFAPDSDSSPEGHIVYPSGGGATNFQAPSYDPATGWMYVVFHESGQKYVRAPQQFDPGKQYWGGRGLPLGEPDLAGVRAIDPETGSVKWEYRVSQASIAAGLLSTGGGLVFAATREGNLIALDSKTGEPLWHFQTGGAITASPMSYAVNGKQFVAISAAGVLYSFALPSSAKSE